MARVGVLLLLPLLGAALCCCCAEGFSVLPAVSVSSAPQLLSPPGSRPAARTVSSQPALPLVQPVMTGLVRRGPTIGRSPVRISVRPPLGVIPGSRRDRYGWRAAPATLHVRPGSTAPGTVRPASGSGPSVITSGTTQRRVSPTGSSRGGRVSRPASRSQLPPLPPVYRNLCRQRRPSALTGLAAPLRSVCRDYWRRRSGLGAARPLPSPSAGEKYVGASPLTDRRRRRHRAPPARAAGPPPADDDTRFYKPYWPYKRNGRRYY